MSRFIFAGEGGSGTGRRTLIVEFEVTTSLLGWVNFCNAGSLAIGTCSDNCFSGIDGGGAGSISLLGCSGSRGAF